MIVPLQQDACSFCLSFFFFFYHIFYLYDMMTFQIELVSRTLKKKKFAQPHVYPICLLRLKHYNGCSLQIK